jgi:hypothetical protein
MVEYTYLELFLFCTSVIGLAFSLKYREEARSHHKFISVLLNDKEMREKVFETADTALDQARKEGII